MWVGCSNRTSHSGETDPVVELPHNISAFTILSSYCLIKMLILMSEYDDRRFS
jgi:hypothetical protein